jgi:hypothetical protein
MTGHDDKIVLLRSKGLRVPTPLEAVIMVGVLNLGPSIKGKDYYFGKEGKFHTFTATDTVFERQRLMVGAASSDGTEVNNDYFNGHDEGCIGVAAVADVVDFLDFDFLDEENQENESSGWCILA